MQYKQFLVIPVLFSLVGCGATAGKYQPIVDQPNAQYSADLKDCQNLAAKRSYLNDDVKTSAVAGATIGTLLSGFDSWGDVAGSAAAGAVITAGSRAWEVREERKQIIMECLRGRNHLVAG